MFPQPQRNEIDHIIRTRLLQSPADVKSHFPPILHNPDLAWGVLMTSQFFLLTFLTKEVGESLSESTNKGYGPYPGLITIEKERKASFDLAGRNNFFIDCKIKNLYSFRINPDTTAIIQNHHQILNTRELGTVKYVVDLSYLLSFGEEITLDNYISYLDGLIVYSIEYWRSINGQ